MFSGVVGGGGGGGGGGSWGGWVLALEPLANFLDI